MPDLTTDDINPNNESISEDTTPPSAEADSSYTACIPLPDSQKETVNEGDDFEGQITGKVIMKDGQMQVEVDTINGDDVPESKEEEGEAEYTGTDNGDGDLSSNEALDKFMKGRKATQ